MYFYKYMFTMFLFSGTLISISSYSWMGMWMGFEINLLSFIPLISSTKNSFESEAAMKYFITQALASTILLFSIIMMSMKFMYNHEIFTLIFNSSLLTKMGAAPFHFWFPEVMEGLNWINAFMLMTWQKIAPMVIFMYSNLSMFFCSMIITFCMIISGIFGLNQTSLRKIMAYSSINHIGWMISSMMFNENVWFMYLITYTFITFNIIIIFFMMNMFFLKQLIINLNNKFMIKLFFMLNFLSLGGLPPFLGFMPKWMTIQMMIKNNLFSLTFIMIIFTLMTLYFYLRIIMSMLIMNINELNFLSLNKLSLTMVMIINFLTLLGLFFCTLIFNFN